MEKLTKLVNSSNLKQRSSSDSYNPNLQSQRQDKNVENIEPILDYEYDDSLRTEKRSATVDLDMKTSS